MPAGSGTTKRAERRRTTNPLQHSLSRPRRTSWRSLPRFSRPRSAPWYEAILYPGVENFTRYFRLQNYWTQQAGLFSMSAKKAMLEHPELDYNLQHSHYNGTVRNQLAADFADQRRAIETLAQHYGVMFFYRGQDPIDGQLVQVIKNFRETYHLSVIPVSVDGIVNPLLPDTRMDGGQASRLGIRYFPALMLADPKSGAVKPVSYGFISQDDLAKQFLNVSTDFAPNF
ncbi:type-F conjugative transfer system pilin assembly protein TraF (plasmid) [Citrobacter freundii]|uniref:type-F conjugative transfer system pilin assembly protein TraF n=1 Tax=Citrobacter freundii TaxID=546 RepID=UPI001F05857C|nr:type-F conjugative transfer system pilin assembly protein TraF [Citrobacter freundii]UMB67332.1 type-F conjugative transfer system pilin assembly protein TraF [Citrobacter freundii]